MVATLQSLVLQFYLFAPKIKKLFGNRAGQLPNPSGLRGVVLHLGLSRRAHKPCRTRDCALKHLSFSGCDPRIHKETGRVLIVRWIAGSKSGNDNKKEPRDNKSNGKEEKSGIFSRFLFNPLSLLPKLQSCRQGLR